MDGELQYVVFLRFELYVIKGKGGVITLSVDEGDGDFGLFQQFHGDRLFLIMGKGQLGVEDDLGFVAYDEGFRAVEVADIEGVLFGVNLTMYFLGV